MQVQAWRPPTGEPATEQRWRAAATALRSKPVTVRPAARHPATARTDVERRDERCGHIDRSKESKHRRRFVFSWKQTYEAATLRGRKPGWASQWATLLHWPTVRMLLWALTLSIWGPSVFGGPVQLLTLHMAFDGPE